MTVEEFQIEVMPCKNKLFRFARRLLKSKEEAEDTVQEIFLRLWAKRDELGRYRSVEAFAMTMTKNLCLDKLKSLKNKVVEMSDHEMKYNEKEPDEEAELSDTIQRVHKIINELPDLQKMVIQLRDIEGYEFEEISEILQMNLSAVRTNLSRARKKVRDEMIKENNYEFSRN